MPNQLTTAIETWLTVPNGQQAIDFYLTAFQARETYRMEDPGGGIVVRLAVDGAGFWISGGSGGADESLRPSDGNMRLILIVADPDAFFARAIRAGATEVFPVGEEYGWRLGRLVDPFGFHWEIGHPLEHS
jgi:PhnB protein